MLIDLGSIKKYAIYVVAAAAIVFNFGVMVAGWWTPDNTAFATIDTVLGFLGLGSIRMALAHVFDGIDLGPVGTWLTGKKTYILAIAGAVFNIGSAFLGWNVQMPWVQFVNALFGALGVGTFANAMGTYKTETLKAAPQSTLALNK
jgi:hypothetical protein